MRSAANGHAQSDGSDDEVMLPSTLCLHCAACDASRMASSSNMRSGMPPVVIATDISGTALP